MTKEVNMQTVDTVLFDFDGTVMNTNDIIIQSWQHTFRTIDGREKAVEEIVATFGEPLETTMGRFFPGVSTVDAIQIYRGFHYERFQDLITIFPGINELLEQLRERYYKTGVVTSRLRATTKIGLDKYDLGKYFDVVITKEDSQRHKPNPEPILTALDSLNAEPERTLMLGDTTYDMICARRAGVTSILVGWTMALSDKEAGGEATPDFVISKPDELWNILNR